MFISTPKDAPKAGAIITVRQARSFIAAYRARMAKTKVAFDKLREMGIPVPFDPAQETLGWVFSRAVLEEVIHQVGKDEEYFVLAFGIAPREHDADGAPIPGSPDVVHGMLTPATKTGDGVFLINKLVPSLSDDTEFGAEQGNTCCQGGSLFDCTDHILATGTFFSK